VAVGAAIALYFKIFQRFLSRTERCPRLVGQHFRFQGRIALPTSLLYIRNWLGEIDGLSPWRQVRFSIRVLLRMPTTAHVEGSYARLARATVAWAFPREGTSDEMMSRRISPQPRQLSLNRHRDLTHDDTLSTNNHALNRHQRKRMTTAD
jgi:hypothetical protein